jgi:hypothetical protein
VKVAVLIPNRSDGGRRDDLLAWTTERLGRLHPGFQIAVGHHDADEGAFNRSAALNRAAAQASDADVFVLADGDSFVGAEQLDGSVMLAAATGQVTFAYDRYCYLSRSMSDRVLAGFEGDWTPGVEFTMQGTCSSMVVVPASLWWEIGGADEGFVGWGGEDVALSLALQTFGGGLQRVHGDVWHLWHAPAPHVADDLWPGRVELYADASYDRPKMAALLERLRADA